MDSGSRFVCPYDVLVACSNNGRGEVLLVAMYDKDLMRLAPEGNKTLFLCPRPLARDAVTNHEE
ncbi:MAG: hypothetical protein M0P70_02420 [Desulfobulbaceae bacterium]|nr:hypothetical protein [Desulfobulbaceae bacterium]